MGHAAAGCSLTALGVPTHGRSMQGVQRGGMVSRGSRIP